jgi:tetratricopeptide (TPR) repeat protein
MLLDWLNAREATAAGAALADDFVQQSSTRPAGTRAKNSSTASSKELQNLLQRFLQRVDREVRPLKLNLFKRAKLANSFKWRLLERGIEQQIVDELTQALVLRLSGAGNSVQSADNATASTPSHASSDSAHSLLEKANGYIARGEVAEAVRLYEDSLRLNPKNPDTHNNLGAAFCRLGEYNRAEEHFRRAMRIRPNLAAAHNNLGTLLRLKGRIVESELPLRRALKLKPAYVDAQVSLGMTLVILGRLREARELLNKAMKLAPRDLDALLALGYLVGREGRFTEAEDLFRRALEIDVKAPGAWVGLSGLRKMTAADASGWLKGAEASAKSGLEPLAEARVRFAIGKYYDDINEFGRAFRSFQEANELAKMGSEAYDGAGRTQFVDGMIRTYTREALSHVPKGASNSTLPVLVVGMPRSGTSLVEQVIASHPMARGAGELRFWGQAMRKHPARLWGARPDQRLVAQLAEEYLQALGVHGRNALRVVDKTPFNSDYLGAVHSIFPNAHFIYVRRDPLDSCLSCYFQDFPPSLNFTLDLSALAHYYREHHRLIEHWRAALPPKTLLDVPYAELIADQEGWTRRILDFLELEWDERCLNFEQTDRSVLTASYWQVRQKIYKTSVGRWRHYEKSIEPLLALKGLD